MDWLLAIRIMGGAWHLKGSLEAPRLSLSLCFWITLGHLDYVFGTCTFRTNFGTLDFWSRKIHFTLNCYSLVKKRL